jgi:REP element-mobilizing transposase RayT
VKFEVRSYSHAVGEFNYHIQITPAYRQGVMVDERVDRLVKAYIGAKLNELRVRIASMKGGPDHLHIFVKDCKTLLLVS